MEFIILILATMLYFWLVVPIYKKKVGYLRSLEPTVFYDYKTKWQMPFELAVIAITVILIIILTPILDVVTLFLIPVAFVIILVTRGNLEKHYHPGANHHKVSYLHAIAITVAFTAVAIFGLLSQ